MITDSKHQASKSGSLQDYCPVEYVTEDGLIGFKDGGLGFALSLECLDTLTYEANEYQNLHEQWRNFLHLKPQEEIQITFRKTGNFEKIFSEKVNLSNKAKGPITKRLFWAQMDELLTDVENVNVLEFESILVFRDYSRKSKKQISLQVHEQSIRSRREELELRLETMRLSSFRLGQDHLFQVMARAANGLRYLPLKEGEEWPQINLQSSEVKIDDQTFRALTLKKLPESYSELGMIQAITLLPFPLEMSVRFRGKDLEPVKRKIERRRQTKSWCYEI